MILYMIRHGESEANAGGFHSGWSCVHLSEKGRMQAERARLMMEKIEIDELYVSDILRTQETAEIIFPGKDRKFMPLAREMNTTPLKGKTKDQMTAVFGETYLECRRKLDYTPLGMDCETIMHVSMRARQLLKWAMTQENKSICIVSHAGFIKAIAGWILSITPHSDALSLDNASLSVFEFKNGNWRIRLWNQTP